MKTSRTGPRVRRVLVAVAVVATMLNLSSGTSFAVEFCNTAPIIGSNGGAGNRPSNPYPSSIEVSGLTGTVTDVNVRLLDVSTRGGPDNIHWIEDADILVAAPDNSNVILMSDAGGNNSESSGPVVNVDLTFDDQAANQLPADSALSSGTFRPVNDNDDVDPQLVPDDEWPAPAPAPSGSVSLNTFNGIANPNGTWSLFASDDYTLAGFDILGGWCVDILTTTSPTTTSGPTTSTTSTTLPPTTTTSTTSTTLPPTTTTSTSTTSTSTTSTTLANTCDGRTATIVGTSGKDTLVGTEGPDVILGLGGDDTIRGLGGDDVICAGDGNDQVLGGTGNDRIFGEGGNDQLFGEDGNDTLSGGAGTDRLSGGNGNDGLSGDASNDQCLGDAGTDTAATCESVIGVP